MIRPAFLAMLVRMTPALIPLPTAQADSPSYPLVGARLLGGTGYEGGRDVAVADDGSVYVLGWTRTQSADNAGMADILLAKFGPTGGPKWVHLLGGSQDEQPGGVAVGPGGSIFISGTTNSPSVAGVKSHGQGDALLAKYTPTGERAWVELFGTRESDGASDIAIDDAGAVYVSGSYQAPSRSDMMLARFDTNGNREWLRRRGGSGDDLANAVAVRSDSAVYLAGETWSPKFLGHTNQGEADAVLFRFYPGGGQAWVRYYGTPLIDRFNAVTSASDVYVYAAGAANTPLCCGAPSDFGDLLVARYDDQGRRFWADRHGSASLDSGNGVWYSPNGGAYVVGDWAVKPFDRGDSKAFLFEYGITRHPVARRFVGGPKQDGAAGVAVGIGKSVWVVGTTAGPIGTRKTAGRYDIVLYRFKPTPHP